jgi:hypothetical protein
VAGHVPPPDADEAVERAAHAYLVAVQGALGTSHKGSVMGIALMGVVKVARRFGVSTLDIFTAVRQVERAVIG